MERKSWYRYTADPALVAEIHKEAQKEGVSTVEIVRRYLQRRTVPGEVKSSQGYGDELDEQRMAGQD